MDNETEVCIQTLKTKPNACTASYIEKQGNSKIKNLTHQQHKGLKSLKEKKKEKEIIIFEIDKSKRFSCDTPDNYKLLGQTHTQNDDEINMETKDSYEKLHNAHSRMWVRFLNAGKKTNNCDRIRSSMLARNNPPAPLAIRGSTTNDTSRI